MYTLEEFDNEKSKVMKFIVYKRRSEQEVRNKFRNEIDENMLDDIIAYLEDAGYLNDDEYIEKKIQEMMKLKNLSVKELKYKLMSKGLKTNQIEDYIYRNREKLVEYELESAKKIIIKKSDLMEKEEIEMFLLKKGYNHDLILEALEEQ